MIINDLNTEMYLSRFSQDSKVKPGVSKETNPNMGMDKIVLSSASKELARYVQQAKTLQTDEKDRVNQIKAQMAAGTYEISSQQIARAMLTSMED